MMLKNQNYIGTKTGITDTAGPCLACTFDNGDSQFIVLLLNSKSMEDRWQEVPKLIDWALHR